MKIQNINSNCQNSQKMSKNASFCGDLRINKAVQALWGFDDIKIKNLCDQFNKKTVNGIIFKAEPSGQSARESGYNYIFEIYDQEKGLIKWDKANMTAKTVDEACLSLLTTVNKIYLKYLN